MVGVSAFPFTIKSRSSFLAPAHPGGPGKKGPKTAVVQASSRVKIKTVKFFKIILFLHGTTALSLFHTHSVGVP